MHALEAIVAYGRSLLYIPDIEATMTYHLLLLNNFLLISFGAYVAKTKYQTLLSPVFIYSILWGVALTLVITDFTSNLFRPDTFVLSLIELSMLFYILGNLLVPTHQNFKLRYTAKRFKSLLNIYKFIAPLTILLCGLFLASVIDKYGLDIYFGKGYEIHGDMLSEGREENYPFGMMGYRIVQFMVHPLVYLCAAMGGALIVNSNKLRLIYFLPIISAILYDLAVVGRFRTYITLITFVFAFLLKRKYSRYSGQRLKKPAYNGKSVLLVFFLLGAVLYGGMAMVRTYYVGKIFNIWGYQVPSVVFQPILYQFGGIYAFSHSYESYEGVRYGMEILYPFIGKPLKYIGFEVLPFEYILEDLTQIGRDEYIVAFYTYLFVAYRDFGIIGLIVYPFFLGLISGKVFFKAWVYGDPLWSVNLLFMLAVVIFPSTIVWAFSDFGKVVGLFYIILLTIWLRNKGVYQIKSHPSTPSVLY